MVIKNMVFKYWAEAIAALKKLRQSKESKRAELAAVLKIKYSDQLPDAMDFIGYPEYGDTGDMSPQEIIAANAKDLDALKISILYDVEVALKEYTRQIKAAKTVEETLLDQIDVLLAMIKLLPDAYDHYRRTIATRYKYKPVKVLNKTFIKL